MEPEGAGERFRTKLEQTVDLGGKDGENVCRAVLGQEARPSLASGLCLHAGALVGELVRSLRELRDRFWVDAVEPHHDEAAVAPGKVREQ